MNERLYRIPPDWPQPSLEALETSRRLVERIRAEIAAADGGVISFERFMDMALYEPGLGYYSAGATKFGAAGDFVTAPGVSGLFGRALARQVAEVLAAAAGDVVLELGAGDGRLAADVLAGLREQSALPERYLILEVSASLKERQRKTLERCAPDLMDRVQWLDVPPTEPFDGAIIANEVVDALPVRRFVRRTAEPREQGVVWAGDGFDWCEYSASADLAAAVNAIEAERGAPLADGYESEVLVRLEPWIAGICAGLRRGAALFIDYGYPRAEFYHPERRAGTLVCQYRHRAHPNPFVLPGLQDITAFVDFTALAEAGLAAGLEVSGYTTQAHFLMGCGLPSMLEDAALDSAERLRLAQQAKTLMMPGEMGERFKVMALGRGMDRPLSAFAMFDHRGRLG